MQGQLNLSGANQAAGRLQAARPYDGIHFGDEYGLLRAVGQGHGVGFRPDDVVLQTLNLLRTQPDAGHQCQCLGGGEAVVHQGFVLGFVIGITVQPAITGQLVDLFVDELLFVIAVAQPLVQPCRIGLQLAQHIVAAQPAAVVAKARVGLYQPARTVGADVVQAAVGQADGYVAGMGHIRYIPCLIGGAVVLADQGDVRAEQIRSGRQPTAGKADRAVKADAFSAGMPFPSPMVGVDIPLALPFYPLDALSLLIVNQSLPVAQYCLSDNNMAVAVNPVFAGNN